MTQEKFDAIVVGAGPAGSTAALLMARAGLNVALLERGEYPGAKNMFGGVMYRWPLEEIIPKFWEKAPIDRYVIEHRIMMLTKNSGLTLNFRDPSYGEPPYNSFTVNRSKFDRWYASQAEEAGALLATSVTVTDLIWEGKKIVGVRSGAGKENELYADIVIGADGVVSTTAVKSGLAPPLQSDEVALGVKEAFEMPTDAIDNRFNIGRKQGIAASIIGITQGKMGGGFVYTLEDSVSIGMVILLKHLIDLKSEPYVLLDQMESHPLISPLLSGGKAKEYSAHLIPEAGYGRIPEKLYLDGLLLTGDAAFLVDLLYFEGTNLAMLSGKLAAETAITAKKEKDFSSRILSRYQESLFQSYVIKELYKRREIPKLMASNERLFNTYPELLNSVIKEIMASSGVSREERRKTLMKRIKKEVGWWTLLKDAVAMRKMIP